MRAGKQDGTLALQDLLDSEVHVVVADLADSGALLRVDGHGRAPYEQDGDIVTAPREGGGTVYALPSEVP